MAMKPDEYRAKIKREQGKIRQRRYRERKRESEFLLQMALQKEAEQGKSEADQGV